MSIRVLIVGPSWVGDMVMAQSLFKTLLARAPETEIDVLAPAWSLPVIARMPEVRRGIAMPVGHGKLRWGLRRSIGLGLRSAGYEQAIVLPRSFKSALVPFHARIPHRIGYLGEWRWGILTDIRPLDKEILTQTVQRFVALGIPRTTPLPPELLEPRLTVDMTNRERLLSQLGLDTARPIVGLMPGAEYGPAKCWPLEYFGQLAADLHKAGRQVWILGSEKDRMPGDRIVADSGGTAVNLSGRTQLEDAIDLLSLTEHAITNDSGLMHIAAAVGTHVVAIYGSTTPDFTPALTKQKTVFYLRLNCSPCFRRECPLGHLRCLREITPQQVLASVLAG